MGSELLGDTGDVLGWWEESPDGARVVGYQEGASDGRTCAGRHDSVPTEGAPNNSLTTSHNFYGLQFGYGE